MPLNVKDKPFRDKDAKDLYLKRLKRDNRRTKYFIKRKDKTPEDYEKVKLIVDGKEMELSDSSKFLLEQLIKDEGEE